MNRPRIVCALRIAWSVAWGIAAVLLIALWVRSAYRRDVVAGVLLSHEFVIESVNGNVAFMSYYLNPAFSPTPFELISYGPKSANGGGPRLNYPLRDWALATLFVTLAIVPWTRRPYEMRWRFSLGTLLIATTLVAVVLGLIGRLIEGA